MRRTLAGARTSVLLLALAAKKPHPDPEGTPVPDGARRFMPLPLIAMKLR